VQFFQTFNRLVINIFFPRLVFKLLTFLSQCLNFDFVHVSHFKRLLLELL
jgi:hypothetical protein